MSPFEIIKETLAYIELNLDRPLSLQEVAEHFAYSKYYFQRLFKAVMGISLNQYVLRRRLNKSIALLTETNWSVTTIALDLAFSSPSSFSRAFKKEYGISASELRAEPESIQPTPVPNIVDRPIKNLNGDIVSDFTINELEPMKVSGFVFQFNVSKADFHQTLAHYANKLLDSLDYPYEGPAYIIYSDCLPNTTTFNLIVGIPLVVNLDLPYFFTVDVPNLFVAQFQYSGRLIEMTDVLNSDYARFLKIARQTADPSHINMIQRFDSIHDLTTSYQLSVPIIRMEKD